jgi:signal transduction protein with GAF and PtsI domain
VDPAAKRIVTIARELLEGDDLDDILERVLAAACELTGARYAALGVLNERRDGLERFVTTGVDPDTHAAIGDLPQGHGVLGELIRHPSPLRLADVSAHPPPTASRSATRRCGPSWARRS